MKENVAKRKNRAGAFYYSRFVFDLKNQIMHKLFPTKKNYNLNLRKKFMPQKIAQPTPNGTSLIG